MKNLDKQNIVTLKVLLTILTIVLAVIVPIWIGPETIDEEKNSIILEWAIGALKLIGILVVIVFIVWVFYGVYSLWDEIVDKFKN
jgi:hypothetical protein